MQYILGYDRDTLRELIDADQCRARLDELGPERSFPALLERSWLLKVLGRPEEAVELSENAVRLARLSGTRKDLIRARMSHASALLHVGDAAGAIRELTSCAEEAEGHEWSAIAAQAYQHRGRTYFELGELNEARADFKRSLFLRKDAGANDDEISMMLLSIDAVDRRRVLDEASA